MARRLDDTRVGEYKVNWGYNFIYTILILSGVVGVFLLPTCVVKNGDLETFYSPVNYLINNDYHNMAGVCSIAYISLFGLLLLNAFLTLSINKLFKSFWVKTSKIIELILVIGCLTTHAIYLLNSGNINHLALIKYYFYWLPIMISIIIFCLINYFRTKKITIYD